MEHYIVIDVETTNSLDDPLCYDVGFAVIDDRGKVFEAFSFVVKEIFLDSDLMSVAHFADKIPAYWQDIWSGKRRLVNFTEIVFTFRRMCAKYGIYRACAHNARFDNRALNYTQRYLTGSKYRYFFPYGTEIWDTLKMSREVLAQDIDYRTFCTVNGYITKRNQIRFTAEIIYRFLAQENNFQEEHTGLADVLIEKDILTYCLWVSPNIDGMLWGRITSPATYNLD